MADFIPTTLAAILIIVVGVIPGVPADVIFGHLSGKSWLEKDFQRFFRILAFSVVGLVGYGALSEVLHLPPPSHVIPSTFASNRFSTEDIGRLSIGWIGQLVVAAVVGALTAGGLIALRKRFTSSTFQQDSWDRFIRESVGGRWIILGIKGGATYAGMLEQADIAREPDYRDLILAEPALYDSNSGNYISTGEQFLYLRGDQIERVSAVTNLGSDKRVTEIGKAVFPSGAVDGKTEG